MEIIKPASAANRNISSPTADNVTIVVQLTNTIERIPLRLQTLKAGDWIETVETFLDNTEPSTYDAECTRVVRSGSSISVSLNYDPAARRNRTVKEDYPEMEWGTMALLISEDLTEASAIFEPNGGAPVAGKCTVFQPSLYANLSRGQVNLLLRPGQSAFRKQLLERYGRCAISNESTPDALEAAHLIDHYVGGSAELGNGILLRADLHDLFDCGKLQISTEGKISLEGVLKDSQYHSDLRERWNKKLPQEVFLNIREALIERAKVHRAADKP